MASRSVSRVAGIRVCSGARAPERGDDLPTNREVREVARRLGIDLRAERRRRLEERQG